MPDNFELGLHVDDLDGTISARMVDNDGIENNILHNDVANGIRVRWNTEGLMAPWIHGTWELQAAVERIGGAPASGAAGEFTIPEPPLELEYVAGHQTLVIPVPAGTVPAGAYKVVVMTTLTHPGLTPFVYGFVEIPMVRFRE